MLQLAFFVLAALTLLVREVRRRRRLREDRPAGPPISSWLAGHWLDFYIGESDASLRRWSKEYGGVVSCRGALGSSFLVVSDPTAIRHIFGPAKSWYDQAQLGLHRARLWGPNILAAPHTDHHRHRKILQTAFTPSRTNQTSKAIQRMSQQLCDLWERDIDGATAVQRDVSDWMHRLSFDCLALSGFSVSLATLENGSDETLKAYSDLLEQGFANRSAFRVFVRETAHQLPPFALPLLALLDPQRSRARWHSAMVARQFARKVIDRRLSGERSDQTVDEDLLDTLLKANQDESEGDSLTNDELAGEVGVFLLAGHDTTSVAMSWALYQLALDPHIQQQLRSEIRGIDQTVTGPYTTDTYSSMPLLDAVIKECLRLHPSLPDVRREALKDDVLPLAQPVHSSTGRVITAVSVTKGTVLDIDIASYNRSKALFGEDADTFRPARWLDEKGHVLRMKTHGGLLSFVAGPRSCLGWRFAILEMQVFLVDLIRAFDFAPVPGVEIVKHFQLVSAPRVRGEEDRGSRLPLLVKRAR